MTEGVILNVSTFINFYCLKILKSSKLQLTMMSGTIGILIEPLYFRLRRNGPSCLPTFKVSIIKKNVEKNLKNNPHSKNWGGKRWSHVKCPTPLLNGKIFLQLSNSYSFMQQANWETCWFEGNLIISQTSFFSQLKRSKTWCCLMWRTEKQTLNFLVVQSYKLRRKTYKNKPNLS